MLKRQFWRREVANLVKQGYGELGEYWILKKLVSLDKNRQTLWLDINLSFGSIPSFVKST